MKPDQIKQQISIAKQAVIMNHGDIIGVTLVDALLDACRKDAFIDRSTAKVDIHTSAMDEALNDAELRAELKSAMYRVFAAISDVVACEERQKLSKEEEREREMEAI